MTKLRLLRAVAAAGVLTGALLVAPTPAFAGTGDHTTTVTCGPPQSPASGTAHAKIRNCSIIWGENTIAPAINYASLSFQLLDSSTDGVCAKAVVTSSLGTHTFTECNGVWTTHTVDFNDYVPNIKITLSYGSSGATSKTYNNAYPNL